MSKHLRAHGKLNRIGRTPRSIAVEAVPLAPMIEGPKVPRPDEFNNALVAFGTQVLQDWLEQGVVYIDDAGILRVRKESS